jgi:hypothetical protein
MRYRDIFKVKLKSGLTAALIGMVLASGVLQAQSK